jgi:ABC-type proline/glycine betaine transport system permease subunit
MLRLGLADISLLLLLLVGAAACGEATIAPAVSHGGLRRFVISGLSERNTAMLLFYGRTGIRR